MLNRSKPLVFFYTFFALIALVSGYFAYDVLEQRAVPEFKNATLYPPDFRALPEFSLFSTQEKHFSNQDLVGQWTVLFFGFTHCPDVCPNTLTILQQAYAELPNPERVQVVFISVDPERDDWTHLQEYVDYFNPAFLGVTGDLKALKVLTDGMSIHFEKRINDADPLNYQVDHTSALFVINPLGRQHALISPPHLPGAIASDLTTMMGAFNEVEMSN